MPSAALCQFHSTAFKLISSTRLTIDSKGCNMQGSNAESVRLMEAVLAVASARPRASTCAADRACFVLRFLSRCCLSCGTVISWAITCVTEPTPAETGHRARCARNSMDLQLDSRRLSVVSANFDQAFCIFSRYEHLTKKPHPHCRQ